MISQIPNQALYIDHSLEAGALVAGPLSNVVACHVAPDGASGLLQAAGGGYSVILLDLQLPDMSGLAVIRQMRSRGDTTPIIVITGNQPTLEESERIMRAGADAYLSKPVDMDFLFEAIQRVTARRAQKVLLVDDDSGSAAVIQQALESPLELVWVQTAMEALDELRAASTPFTAVMLDLRQPGDMDGCELLKLFRASTPEAMRDVVVIVYSAAPESAVQTRQICYDAYLQKPVDAPTAGAKLQSWIAEHRERRATTMWFARIGAQRPPAAS